MAKSDTFVPAGEVDTFASKQTNPELWVMRFADDNDSSQFSFGCFCRQLKSIEEVEALVKRSSGQRYMGRKRHCWYKLIGGTR